MQRCGLHCWACHCRDGQIDCKGQIRLGGNPDSCKSSLLFDFHFHYGCSNNSHSMVFYVNLKIFRVVLKLNILQKDCIAPSSSSQAPTDIFGKRMLVLTTTVRMTLWRCHSWKLSISVTALHLWFLYCLSCSVTVWWIDWLTCVKYDDIIGSTASMRSTLRLHLWHKRFEDDQHTIALCISAFNNILQTHSSFAFQRLLLV